ncbi:MAG: hypothetical protein ACREDM_16605 [Methylocella sp.]
MRPLSIAIATSLLMLVASCATESGPAQGTPQTQWKEVTRMVNGTFVTYQVPVGQAVPGSAIVRKLGPEAKVASAPVPEAGKSAQRAQSQQVAGDAGSPPADHPSAADASSTAISQEAEVEMAQAEITVRDLRTRYEDAQTALHLARSAAQRGDSASVSKYAKIVRDLGRSTDKNILDLSR